MTALYDPAASDAAYAPIGHNRPNLPELLSTAAIRFELGIATETLKARRDEMVEMCHAFVADHPEIGSDEEQATATDVVRQARAHVKLIEDSRVSAKEPFRRAGETVDTFFRPLKDRLADAITPVAAAMNRHADRVLAHRRAKAMEEARLAAERARQAEAAARTTGQFDDAIAAAEEAAAADAAANAPPADLTRVRTDLGSVSSGTRVWNFEVLDEAVIPNQYRSIDLSKIARDIRRKENPVRSIPGVRIFCDIVTRVR